MSMTCSQKINDYDPSNNSFDDEITVTNVPKGKFLAVTSILVADGSSTREVRVDLFSIDVAAGGTNTVNTGLFERKNGETAIKASVYSDGNLVCENTTNYP